MAPPKSPFGVFRQWGRGFVSTGPASEPASADETTSSPVTTFVRSEAAAPDGADPVEPEPVLDPVAAAAVELARAAAEDVAEPDTVGEHLGVRAEADGLVLHTFACTAGGYRGWQWAVTLARVEPSDDVTVCDSVLLPGSESVQSPQWLPWADRLAPGDVGAGDELPYRGDDPLLVPGYEVTDEQDADQVALWELGLGRVRVLGALGREETAERWYAGASGPTGEISVQASAPCSTCGYFLPLAGSLRRSFGACANEWSPSDGAVVSVDHGCGAHSETDLEPPAPEPVADPILDETVIDAFDILTPDPEPAVEVVELVEVTEVTKAVEVEAVEVEVAEVEVAEIEVAEIEVAEAADVEVPPESAQEPTKEP